MGRISDKFAELKAKGAKAFIPFITAGDPDMATTSELIVELERSGADLIELGVPFSDPIADGPVIQRSSERSLKRGTNLYDVLDLVKQLRARSQIPIVLFSYFNPLLQFGLDRLADEAKRNGIDGVLATDLTPEEAEGYIRIMRSRDLDTIFLVAPTSSTERILLITRSCSGFVYLISRTGVTGPREELPSEVVTMIGRIRQHTDLPIAVGFGISKPEHVRAVWQHAEAAVVGSAIVAKVEEFSQDSNLVRRVGEFALWLKGIRRGEPEI